MNEINKTKIGFNYFQDYDHFRDEDAKQWLPVLKDMNTGWLVLNAPTNMAISETFIKSILSSGIDLILHFKFSPKELPNLDDFRLLVKTYASWGVRFVSIFDRPNMRSEWDKLEWQQANIVKRFADLFAMVAQPIMDAGMMPILPPLQPGGDFWDTAFLDNLLTELKTNHSQKLVHSIGVGAYAWFHGKPVTWGAGGQDIFPATKPYMTPSGSEDNKGFHIFDWYNTIVYSHVENGLPIFLMGVGEEKSEMTAECHLETLEGVLDSLKVKQTDMLKRMPENVMSCNFWVLAAKDADKTKAQAWFSESGETLRSAELLQTIFVKEDNLANDTVLEENFQEEGFHEIVEEDPEAATFVEETQTEELKKEVPVVEQKTAVEEKEDIKTENKVEMGIGKPIRIQNYILLPSYEWGVSDWHLDVIKPYVKKYKPTIGFSVKEARSAKEVLVIGVASDFPNQNLSELYAAGCEVTQMRGDAEKIAEALAKA